MVVPVTATLQSHKPMSLQLRVLGCRGSSDLRLGLFPALSVRGALGDPGPYAGIPAMTLAAEVLLFMALSAPDRTQPR